MLTRVATPVGLKLTFTSELQKARTFYDEADAKDYISKAKKTTFQLKIEDLQNN